MFLSLLFSTLVFAATEPLYTGALRTQATAYGSGEKFDRSFAFSVRYHLADAPQGKAATVEKRYCETDDNGYPVSCDQYCETTVSLALGSAEISVLDRNHGLTLNRTLPVTATATRYEPKGRGTCKSQLDLSGLSLYSHELSLRWDEPNGNILELTVDPYFADTHPSDHVMLSRLRALGNDTYGVEPVAPAPLTRAWWAYTHLSQPEKSLTWGTSGMMELKREI